ncbi:MAG: hypothetical protein RLZZ458_2274 [Planctomycetota bacterium]|jgi:hypothetical protein
MTGSSGFKLSEARMAGHLTYGNPGRRSDSSGVPAAVVTAIFGLNLVAVPQCDRTARMLYLVLLKLGNPLAT